jgi:hypothetical protein
MMIEMTVGLSGPAYTLDAGGKKDFPRDEALRLIAAGFAIPAKEEQIERAVVTQIMETRSAPETTPHHKHKKRRR